MISSRKEYDEVMKQIESYIKKATQLGGFDKLSKKDTTKLAELSVLAEQFEDSLPLMPIKTPTSISDMIRLIMYEKNLKQKQLASILEISEAYISGLLSGKRKLSLKLAKKLHSKLGIDAHFILTNA